jgi:hypothetical protein
VTNFRSHIINFLSFFKDFIELIPLSVRFSQSALSYIEKKIHKFRNSRFWRVVTIHSNPISLIWLHPPEKKFIFYLNLNNLIYVDIEKGKIMTYLLSKYTNLNQYILSLIDNLSKKILSHHQLRQHIILWFKNKILKSKYWIFFDDLLKAKNAY